MLGRAADSSSGNVLAKFLVLLPPLFPSLKITLIKRLPSFLATGIKGFRSFESQEDAVAGAAFPCVRLILLRELLMPGMGWDELLGMGFGEVVSLNHSLGCPGGSGPWLNFPGRFGMCPVGPCAGAVDVGSQRGCGNRGGKGSSSSRAGLSSARHAAEMCCQQSRGGRG